MNNVSRRRFLKTSALGTAAAFAAPSLIKGFSNIIPRAADSGEMIFKPYPHPWQPDLNFMYLADKNEDPFKSGIKVSNEGIIVPKDVQVDKFSVNGRWFVEGFGYVVLGADNAGEYYTPEEFGEVKNINYEFDRSRIFRNRRVRDKYEKAGTKFSAEVNHMQNLSEELFDAAKKNIGNPEKCGKIANNSLKYALWAGEKIEIEHALSQIARLNRQDHVYFGCETRQYIWARSEKFVDRFTDLFNYGTITHYVWDSWYELFEPKEGEYNWGVKDNIVNWCKDNNISLEGRPLFWFHPVVTPDWLRKKNYAQLKDYVVKHTEDLVGHYGDDVLHWEVVNEYHDWANIFDHTPEQITEITKLACDTTKEVNPKVQRLINNCAPWAEYAAVGEKVRSDEPAPRPMRSPRKYIEDLHEAGVEYDVLGIQVYFPHRDLSDIMRMIERFEKFNKPIYITEMAASSGYSKQEVTLGTMEITDEPYHWRRRWDEKLQADWLESVYNLYYSKPNIHGICWYDFSDFRPFIRNGGLVREDSSPKRSFFRLQNLLKSWDRLPKKA